MLCGPFQEAKSAEGDEVSLPLSGLCAAGEHNLDTFWRVVQYCYTGHVGDATLATILPLTELADFLQVDVLKKWSVEFIETHVTKDSLPDVLEIAMK